DIVEEDTEKIAKLCQAHHAIRVSVAETKQEAEALTAARRAALSALSRLRPTTILEDATVPRSEVANMVKTIAAIAEKYNVTICTFGHAGDGNLHPTCVTDLRDAEEVERVEKELEEILHHAIELGGTIIGEHGVGAMKAPFLHWKLGEAGVGVMKQSKQALDPNHIMNPGKLFTEEKRKRLVVTRRCKQRKKDASNMNSKRKRITMKY